MLNVGAGEEDVGDRRKWKEKTPLVSPSWEKSKEKEDDYFTRMSLERILWS